MRLNRGFLGHAGSRRKKQTGRGQKQQLPESWAASAATVRIADQDVEILAPTKVWPRLDRLLSIDSS